MVVSHCGRGVASGLLQGRDNTVSSQEGVVETQVCWLSSFSVTAEQKNVCVAAALE